MNESERKLAQVARIRPFEHDDARVGAQTLVQLAVADVDGGDPCGSSLQQDIGEPTRGSADVDGILAGRIDSERIEGVSELLSAA